MWRKILAGAGIAILGLAIVAVWRIGPRNILGMMRYDQRREGELKPGDRAPDVALTGVDGVSTLRLHERIGARPLVLVFGSFT